MNSVLIYSNLWENVMQEQAKLNSAEGDNMDEDGDWRIKD